MQGTYIPQYTPVPPSSVTLEVWQALVCTRRFEFWTRPLSRFDAFSFFVTQENSGQQQQVSMETPSEHTNYSYQHSKWSYGKTRNERCAVSFRCSQLAYNKLLREQLYKSTNFIISCFWVKTNLVLIINAAVYYIMLHFCTVGQYVTHFLSLAPPQVLWRCCSALWTGGSLREIRGLPQTVPERIRIFCRTETKRTSLIFCSTPLSSGVTLSHCAKELSIFHLFW